MSSSAVAHNIKRIVRALNFRSRFFLSFSHKDNLRRRPMTWSLVTDDIIVITRLWNNEADSFPLRQYRLDRAGWRKGGGEGEREREGETDGHRHSQPDRERERERGRQTDRQTETETDRQTERQRDRKSERGEKRERGEREREREGRQTDRQTDLTGRQA